MFATKGLTAKFAGRSPWFPALVVLALCELFSLWSAAVEVALSDQGTVNCPVVVAPASSAGVREAAGELARILSQMGGGTFLVEEGDGSRGIAVGTREDFPGLAPLVSKDFTTLERKHSGGLSGVAAQHLREPESYVLRSHADGLAVVGQSELGVQNAVWDLLRRLGYRQYFPGAIWEVIPRQPRLAIDVHDAESPSFLMRLFWYSGNTYPERGKRLEDWKKKNRMQSGINLKAGHSWENLLSQLKPVLEQRPEFLAEVDGKREWKQAAKFDLSNTELRKLLVDTYLERFRAILKRTPGEMSFSVDPSDGGGWCESAASLAMGSVSDQVVTLANEVAAAMDAEFPDKLIGMYAYNFHSHPPTLPVHPRVVVLVGTHFRRTNLSLKEQIQGWAGQGATVGVRDIISYLGQDYDLPSRAHGWRGIDSYARNIRNLYAWGARLYNVETTDSWAINGLLNYAVARILWDVEDPVNGEELLSEFLENCFPGVVPEVRAFYDVLGRKPMLSADLFHRLYSAVSAASSKNQDRVVAERINDLAVYVRYLELQHAYASARAEARLEAATEMFTHLYRSRQRDSHHARGLIIDQLIRDKTLWTDDPETRKSLWSKGTPPWAETTPDYTPGEISSFVQAGIENNPKLPFETLAFSQDLIPARPLVPAGTDFPRGNFATAVKASRFFTWADEPGVFRLKVTNSGKPYAPRPSLWAAAEASLDAVDARFSDLIVGTGETHEYELKSPHTGLHWLRFAGPFQADDPVVLEPPKPWTMTDAVELGTPMFPYMTRSKSTFYFYVPKGTVLLGLYAIGKLHLTDPQGNEHRVNGSGHLALDVPEGTDGGFWRVEDWNGRQLQLLTVPPYFARHPEELLLPREVVEADAGR